MKTKQKKRLFESLKKLTDYRVDSHKILYPIEEVVFIVLFAIIKGKTTYETMHTWMEFNKENSLLKRIFNKEELRIPSRATIHRIMINIDFNELERIFRDYFSKYKTESISVDGKWLRGSDVNGNYTQESHKAMLNILDKEHKIVIGHKFLHKGKKKSEIPNFNELLDEKELFSKESQIFSFDALLTQKEILNKINKNNQRYIAKVKGNQESLRNQVIEVVEDLKEATTICEDKGFNTEGGKEVKRKVEVFQSNSCDIVLFNSEFNNIQSIIKITKTIIDKAKVKKEKVEYLIANFKTTAKDFKLKILQHWRVETYHYHLDMLTKEDEHIAYIEPFSISILRSFTINFYQIFFNKYKGEKIITSKPLTMARVKEYSVNSDEFALNLFEECV